MVCQRTKILGVATVSTLALAAGGLYYWKFIKRPDSPDSGFPRPICKTEDKTTVSFSDKPTDVMSFTSFDSFGHDWRHDVVHDNYLGERYSSLNKPQCGKSAAACNCKVKSCDHNKCNCGNWNKLSAHERAKSAIPTKTSNRNSTVSPKISTANGKLSCKCSSTYSSKKSRLQKKM